MEKLKVTILAGGKGTRLAEETEVRPKPMVEIGGRPMLWHIMIIYHHFGPDEFIIAAGYLGEYIKRWFRDHCSLEGDMTFHTGSGKIETYDNQRPDWTVHVVDTGIDTLRE